jgi:hypothetical protein
MPNNWTDITADIKNLAELKVVEYVMRHTWGYREFGVKKAITTDEFMNGRKRNDGSRMDKGTGLSNRSVIDGLRLAEEHGYLTSELDSTDKARQVKSYMLKMSELDMKILHIETDESDMKNLHSRYEDVTYLREDSSYQRVESSHRSEKDTIERNSKETPEKEKGEASASSRKPSQPLLIDPAKEQKPPNKPAITLDTPEQEKLWSLWCNVWFNQDPPPTLNATAKEHIANMATWFKTQEQLNSYEVFTRKELAESGLKRKTIFLGNLDNNDRYIRWKQTQATPNVTSLSEKRSAPPASLPPLPKEASTPYRPVIVRGSKPKRRLTADRRESEYQERLQKGAVV